ncbi:MAG: hypothetical protein KGL37_13335 [Acidobacteriota bacterium]|nr:hypothetical protein [Acidobacteriota bacterium]
MATIVVGGGERGVGKTALVCGLIAALPEFRWTAVKISGHDHGKAEPVSEETQAGQGTDTARYLAAGACRSFLMTSGDEELGRALTRFLRNPTLAGHLIFESNRIPRHLRPDLCLAVAGGFESGRKLSFSALLQCADATVEISDRDRVLFDARGEKPLFHLASFQRISPPMLAWIRERVPL